MDSPGGPCGPGGPAICTISVDAVVSDGVLTVVVGGGADSSSVATVATPTIVPEVAAQIERKMSGVTLRAP